MHGGQQGPQRQDEEHDLVEPCHGGLPAELLQEHGGKLQRHHPDVDGHADRRLEQHRGGIEETRNVEVGQIPVTADVDGDGEAAQRIAEQARQQGRSHQRVILAPVEDIDRPGQRPAAAGETGADQQIERDPEPPGVAAVEIGDRAQPEDEAFEDQHAAQDDERRQHHDRPADQPAPQRMCLVITHGPCLPYSGYDPCSGHGWHHPPLPRHAAWHCGE